MFKLLYRLRGGSWLSACDYCRSANRLDDAPDSRYYDLGFRVVRRAEMTRISYWLRGGSWRSYGAYCRSAFRSFSTPVTRFVDSGFRVVRGGGENG